MSPVVPVSLLNELIEILDRDALGLGGTGWDPIVGMELGYSRRTLVTPRESEGSLSPELIGPPGCHFKSQRDRADLTWLHLLRALSPTRPSERRSCHLAQRRSPALRK
jgi:hypothetical protein